VRLEMANVAISRGHVWLAWWWSRCQFIRVRSSPREAGVSPFLAQICILVGDLSPERAFRLGFPPRHGSSLFFTGWASLPHLGQSSAAAGEHSNDFTICMVSLQPDSWVFRMRLVVFFGVGFSFSQSYSHAYVSTRETWTHGNQPNAF